VFVAFHADLLLHLSTYDRRRKAFEPFISTLEEEAETFPGRVVIAHGDSHHFIVDQPLRRRTTGKRLENVLRLEVPGSPDVGWVRVSVTPDARNPFQFDPYTVPRWKIW
jgi:hypothetical protein